MEKIRLRNVRLKGGSCSREILSKDKNCRCKSKNARVGPLRARARGETYFSSDAISGKQRVVTSARLGFWR